MKGQLEPVFKMRKVREGRIVSEQCPEYERYMHQILDVDVFQLQDGNKSWDEIFNGFRVNHLEHSRMEIDEDA